MHLDKDLLIGGVPAKDLRKVLKHSPFTTREFLNRVPKATVNPLHVLEQLLAEGYIVREEHCDDQYETTLKGNTLAYASTRRYSRKAADKAMMELLQRVFTVNTDQEFACVVEELILFGSYMGESPDVGDIDIAYKLRNWSSDPVAQKERKESRKKAHGSFGTFMEELAFPETEVLRFLKSRSPLIKLCSEDQPKRLKVPYVVIYNIDKPYDFLNFIRDKYPLLWEECLASVQKSLPGD